MRGSRRCWRQLACRPGRNADGRAATAASLDKDALIAECERMPQPLSKVVTDASISITPLVLSNCDPRFPAMIMQVIASWAHIDGDLATIFSHVLKADIAVGTAVYQSLQGAEVRKRAFKAAAENALPRWQQLAFETVWRATSKSRMQRHRFAHHVWGAALELPDALLLMDPKVVVNRNVSLRQRVQDLPNGRGVIAPKDYDRDRVFVYDHDDLQRARQDAHDARLLYILLAMTIGEMAIEVGRRQLLNAPLFQSAVGAVLKGESDEVKAQLAPPGNDPPAPGIWETWDKALGRI